jgi:hypothetical protein
VQREMLKMFVNKSYVQGFQLTLAKELGQFLLLEILIPEVQREMLKMIVNESYVQGFQLILAKEFGLFVAEKSYS